MKKLNYWMSMVSDSKTGSVSSKRNIGIFGFLFLVVAMFINIIWGRNATPNTDLIDAVEFITVSALFASTGDKVINALSSKKDKTVEEAE